MPASSLGDCVSASVAATGMTGAAAGALGAAAAADAVGAGLIPSPAVCPAVVAAAACAVSRLASSCTRMARRTRSICRCSHRANASATVDAMSSDVGLVCRMVNACHLTSNAAEAEYN